MKLARFVTLLIVPIPQPVTLRQKPCNECRGRISRNQKGSPLYTQHCHPPPFFSQRGSVLVTMPIENLDDFGGFSGHIFYKFRNKVQNSCADSQIRPLLLTLKRKKGFFFRDHICTKLRMLVTTAYVTSQQEGNFATFWLPAKNFWQKNIERNGNQV